jgi:hypothetical protein
VTNGLDDLLRFEEEPATAGGGDRAGPLRRLLRTALLTGAATAVAVVGLRAVGLRVSLVVLVAAVLAVLGVRRAAARVAPPPTPPPGRPLDGGSDPPAAVDSLARAVDRWENRLVWADGDADRFTRVVLPSLGELVDDLLRQRHGVTRSADPDRARALLGDRLWSLLDTPVRRPPSPREFAAVVAELEQI